MLTTIANTRWWNDVIVFLISFHLNDAKTSLFVSPKADVFSFWIGSLSFRLKLDWNLWMVRWRKLPIVDDHWITSRHIFNMRLNMISSIWRRHSSILWHNVLRVSVHRGTERKSPCRHQVGYCVCMWMTWKSSFSLCASHSDLSRPDTYPDTYVNCAAVVVARREMPESLNFSFEMLATVETA